MTQLYLIKGNWSDATGVKLYLIKGIFSDALALQCAKVKSDVAGVGPRYQIVHPRVGRSIAESKMMFDLVRRPDENKIEVPQTLINQRFSGMKSSRSAGSSRFPSGGGLAFRKFQLNLSNLVGASSSSTNFYFFRLKHLTNPNPV